MFKNTKPANFFKNLTDIRVLGQITFVAIVLMISWSGVKAITRNHELQKEVDILEQEVAISDLENQNLALQNEYLETDEYLDVAARESLGKAARGEKIYVVPNDIAMKYVPNFEEIPQEEVPKPKSSQGNIQDWIDFFFR